jgi:hypothetical protein
MSKAGKWEIKRTDEKPFKSIRVTNRDGWTATFYSHDRNPGNIAYQYFDEVLRDREYWESRSAELLEIFENHNDA